MLSNDWFAILLIDLFCKEMLKKKKNKIGQFALRGGGSEWVDFPLRKKRKRKKNAKMIRMV